MNSLEDESVYANEEISKETISQLILTTSLDRLLADDKAETQKQDEILCWYHGKISREAAENLLQEGKYCSLFII